MIINYAPLVLLSIFSVACSSAPQSRNQTRAPGLEAKEDWPLLSLERPPDALVEPLGTKIQIYPDGRVVKSIIKYVRGSQPVIRETDIATLKGELAGIKRCTTALYRQEFEPTREACDGEIETEVQYKSLYGEKEFALRRCGQLQTVQSKCAQSMIELLDRLEKIGTKN
jgi:hypothetical protein